MWIGLAISFVALAFLLTESGLADGTSQGNSLGKSGSAPVGFSTRALQTMITMSDGEVLVLNDDGKYLIQSSSDPLPPTTWTGVVDTYDASTVVISPAGSTTGIYTIGNATIQAIGMDTTGFTDSDKENSLLNLYGGSDLTVSSTVSDAMIVGKLVVGIPVSVGTEIETKANLVATSTVGNGISFWKSVTLTEDSTGDVTGNTGGIIAQKEYDGTYSSDDGLFQKMGSTLEVTTTGLDTVGISSTNINGDGAILSVNAPAGKRGIQFYVDLNFSSSQRASGEIIQGDLTVNVDHGWGIIGYDTNSNIRIIGSNVIVNVTQTIDSSGATLRQKLDNGGIASQTLSSEKYAPVGSEECYPKITVRADKSYGIAGLPGDSWGDDSEYPDGNIQIHDTELDIEIQEGMGLSSTFFYTYDSWVSIVAEKGPAISVCGFTAQNSLEETLFGKPQKILAQSNGATDRLYQVYNSIPSSAGITCLTGFAFNGGGEIEAKSPLDVAGSYGINVGFNVIDGSVDYNGAVTAGYFMVSDGVINAEGESGIKGYQMNFSSYSSSQSININAKKTGIETSTLMCYPDWSFDTSIDVQMIGNSPNSIGVLQTAYKDSSSTWTSSYLGIDKTYLTVDGAETGFLVTTPASYVYPDYSYTQPTWDIQNSTIQFTNIRQVGIDFQWPDIGVVTSPLGEILSIKGTTIEAEASNTAENAVGMKWINSWTTPLEFNIENSSIKAIGQEYGLYSENVNWDWSATESRTGLEGSAKEKGIYIPTGSVNFTGGTDGIEVSATSTTVPPDQAGRVAALYIPTLTSSDVTFKEVYDQEANTIVVSAVPSNPYLSGMNIADVGAYTWENSIGTLFTAHPTGITSDDLVGVQTIVASSKILTDSFQGPNSHHQVTLKARVNLYTITFDTDGGTPTPSSEELYWGSSITKPTTAKQYYIIDGWYDTLGSDQTYWDFASDTTPLRDVNLKAVWVPQPFYVNFVANGAETFPVTDLPPALYTPHGTPFAEPTGKPKQKGYDFTYWTADAAGTIPWNFAIDPMPTNDIILYAQWEPAPFVVTYHVDGAQGGDFTETVRYLSPVVEPNAPIFTGHFFDGWYTDSSTTTLWDFKTGTMPPEDLDLYAKWISIAELIQVKNKNVVVYKNENTVNEVETAVGASAEYTDYLGVHHVLSVELELNPNWLAEGGVNVIKPYVINPADGEKIYGITDAYLYVLNRPYITGTNEIWIFIGEWIDPDTIWVSAYGEMPNFDEKRIDRGALDLTFDSSAVDIWEVGTYWASFSGGFEDYDLRKTTFDFPITVRVRERQGLTREEQLQVDSSDFWVKVADIYHKMKPGEILDVTPNNYKEGGNLRAETVNDGLEYDKLLNVDVGKYIYMSPNIVNMLQAESTGQMDVNLDGRSWILNSKTTKEIGNNFPKGYYDLRMNVENTDVITNLIGKDIPQMQLKFSMNRPWFGTPIFSITPNASIKKSVSNGSTPYLFHYNENTNELELVGEMSVQKTGNLTIPMNGVYKDYVILTALPANGNYRVTAHTNALSSKTYDAVANNLIDSGHVLPNGTGLNGVSTAKYAVEIEAAWINEAATHSKKSGMGTILSVAGVSLLGLALLGFGIFGYKNRKTEDN